MLQFSLPVLEIKYDLFPFCRFRQKQSNWLKVNEIESLKTVKKVLEFCFHVSVRTLSVPLGQIKT